MIGVSSKFENDEKFLKYIMKNNIFKDYSDDHVAATNHQVISDFDMRSESYSHFGLELKREEDLVQEDLSMEFGFLGGRPVKIKGYWYPYYDGEKILDALTYDLSNLTFEEKYAQLLGYAKLTCANQNMYSVLSNYAVSYFNKEIPPRETLLQSWLQLESST